MDSQASAVATPRVFVQGNERQPVIVIDNFAADPDRMVEEARGLDWKPIGPYFPGVRHPTPEAMAAARDLPSVSERVSDALQTTVDPLWPNARAADTLSASRPSLG